jgi:hypothetical protein
MEPVARGFIYATSVCASVCLLSIFGSTACEDGQLGAHKAVLSAGSPLFRQILRQNPHAHPLLYLRGLKQVRYHN